MATLESMAIRSNAAINRIEQKLITEWGVKSAPLPRIHKDREMLRCNQLERIADMVESVERFQSENTDSRLQDAINLVQSGNWTKSQLETLLLGGNDGIE